MKYLRISNIEEENVKFHFINLENVKSFNVVDLDDVATVIIHLFSGEVFHQENLNDTKINIINNWQKFQNSSETYFNLV